MNQANLKMALSFVSSSPTATKEAFFDELDPLGESIWTFCTEEHDLIAMDDSDYLVLTDAGVSLKSTLDKQNH